MARESGPLFMLGNQVTTPPHPRPAPLAPLARGPRPNPCTLTREYIEGNSEGRREHFAVAVHYPPSSLTRLRSTPNMCTQCPRPPKP